MKRILFLFFFLSWGYGFCQNLEFQGELLYFRPTVEQSYYVISSSHNVFGADADFHPNGKRFNNRPCFDPGFRLRGAYSICEGRELALRFTYFQSTNRNKVSGAFLFDTTGFPGNGSQAPEDTAYSGTASSNVHVRYIALEGLYYTPELFCFCPENLHLFFGWHFASIRFRDRITSIGVSFGDANTPVSNHLKRHSNFWGIGPEIGIDFRYSFPICCQLYSLVLNGRASLLGSHTDARYEYVTRNTGPKGVDLRNRPLWRVNPTVDVKVGINTLICSCFFSKIKFEVGYEMIWISDAIDTIYGLDVAFAGDTIDVFSNLSLQGPYALMAVTF